MTSRVPTPAYQDTKGLLTGDKEFYQRLVQIAESDSGKRLVEDFEIPIRSGKAWVVKKGMFPPTELASPHFCLLTGNIKGQLCRLSTPYGPQVGDLNIWSLYNPRERFWASRTKQLHASHVSVGDRLWSCLPYMRPLCTIVADSLKDYGVDEVGGRCHDLLGTRCDPYGSYLCQSLEITALTVSSEQTAERR